MLFRDVIRITMPCNITQYTCFDLPNANTIRAVNMRTEHARSFTKHNKNAILPS